VRKKDDNVIRCHQGNQKETAHSGEKIFFFSQERERSCFENLDQATKEGKENTFTLRPLTEPDWIVLSRDPIFKAGVKE